MPTRKDSTRIIYGVLAAGILIFLGYILYLTQPLSRDLPSPLPLGFSGTWQSSEGGTPAPLTEDSIPSATETPGILLKGHFDRDIEKNEQVLMYLHKLRVTITQNGQTIYTFGDAPDIMESVGISWDHLTSPGISREGAVEIYIQCAYPATFQGAYALFLNKLCTGDEASLLQQNLRRHAPQIIISGIILVFGFAFIASVLTLRFMKGRTPAQYLACGFLLISGGICTFIDYDYITLLFDNALLINIIDYLSQMLIGEFMLLYFRELLTHKNARRAVTVFVWIWTAVILLYLFFQAAGILDGIELLPYILPVALVMLVITLFLLLIELSTSKSPYAKWVVITGSLLLGTAILETLHFYTQYIYWILLFQLGLLLFTIVQFVLMMKFARDNLEKAAQAQKLEAELVDNRIAIMLSQIQPHFLYNTLAAIQALCRTNPEKAYTALSDFAIFLRGNMDALESPRLIPFEQELVHVRHYLALEKARFEERLHIVYDIQATDFRLPALTVQPIVENAVRHGIMKGPGQGTVTLATRETASAYEIIITDDGRGYSSCGLQKHSRSHVGIENVKSRLKQQCGASMTIASSPGAGTAVTITLPKTAADKSLRS